MKAAFHLEQRNRRFFAGLFPSSGCGFSSFPNGSGERFFINDPDIFLPGYFPRQASFLLDPDHGCIAEFET